MATAIEKAAEEYAAKFYKQHQSLRRTSFLKGASAQSEIDREVLKDAKEQIIHLIDLNGGKGHASSFKILQRIDSALKLTEKQ